VKEIEKPVEGDPSETGLWLLPGGKDSQAPEH